MASSLRRWLARTGMRDRLRFCSHTCCYDSWVCDMRHGLTYGLDFEDVAANGYCVYCLRYVPEHAEKSKVSTIRGGAQ